MPRADPLESRISPGASILADSSVVLAYLAGGEATSDLATQLFDAFVAVGRNPASISAVTVAEILVRPFRRDPAAVTSVEGFLRHFGDLHIVDVTYAVAREAARIRAASDLAMPDALIVASAATSDVDIVVTNDRTWEARLARAAPGLRVVSLTDFV